MSANLSGQSPPVNGGLVLSHRAVFAPFVLSLGDGGSREFPEARVSNIVVDLGSLYSPRDAAEIRPGYLRRKPVEIEVTVTFKVKVDPDDPTV